MPERKKIILAVYTGGLLQGVALILFPAASTLMADPETFALSSAQYGFLFTPNIVAGILASSFAARYAARIGVKRLLVVGLSLDILAMALLSASNALVPTSASYPVVLMAITSVGAGFGLCISVLNAYAFDLFPDRSDEAVTALHVMVGLGQVGASLVLGFFVRLGFWWGAPSSIGVVLLALTLLVVPLRMTLSYEHQSGPKSPSAKVPARAWILALAVLLYGICEGALGNWSPIFLEQDAGLTRAQAGVGLSVFWAAMTAGRALFALAGRWLPSRYVYRISPLVMVVGLLLLPAAGGPASGIGTLALLGAGMSVFFPLSISLSSAESPHLLPTISGLMVAAVGLGIGIGSNLFGFLRTAVGLGGLLFWTAGVAAVIAVLVFALRVAGSPRAEGARSSPA